MTKAGAKADSKADGSGGRPNQKIRTRKSLLEAAARLAASGASPTLDEIAEAALVSRATAYRYFPNVEALLVEAALDRGLPEADAIFNKDRSTDPIARLDKVDAAMHGFILDNEAALRVMLINSLQHKDDSPKRQNRRTPLIEAALAPARTEFRPADLALLKQALAIVLGTEAMVVCKDVLGLDEAETRKVKRWAIRALVQAARRA